MPAKSSFTLSAPRRDPNQRSNGERSLGGLYLLFLSPAEAKNAFSHKRALFGGSLQTSRAVSSCTVVPAYNDLA